MSIANIRTAPLGCVLPDARQVGPVTRAIRGLRPNEAPSFDARQRQIEAEEREALRALRERIAAQIEADQNRIDRCLSVLDILDGDPDFEVTDEDFEDAHDLEPSLCGLSVETGALDDREGPDDNGLGDKDGKDEQCIRFLARGGDLRDVQAWF